MPPKIADAIRILAAETLEGCSNDWSDSAKADEVLRAVYDLIFAAGVQAERERVEKAIGGLLGAAYMEGENAAWNRAIDAALAVVSGDTGKEGASDER